MFLYDDRVSLTVISGSGGPGAVSFYRTRKIPRGGPDGGDGGKGGDIVFSSKNSFKNFSHLRRSARFSADPGGSGQNQLQSGREGRNVIIPVPLGTLLRDENLNILEDFDSPVRRVFLKGGAGGRGNAFFKNSLNQAPRRFHRGKKGRERKIILEFKPLIKVSLIGRANTGKSSFFNTLTGARSPTADYPYTTLVPFYGRIKTLGPDSVLMDIPGLSKGACEKPEKGLVFLRSLQRAELLIHFVDCSGADPQGEKEETEEELRAFDRKFPCSKFSPLNEKKKLIVFTKTDLYKKPPFWDSNSFTLSNKTGEGVQELLCAIKKEISN